jgi:GTP-binding protein HflX
MPRVALVGYTNAGKSTLFNTLTGSDAYAADKLFATLDPTVRRLNLPGGSIMLSDTVGFVRDLPHELVAAFRSTLSEAREADLLLHVIDAADPLRDDRIAQVDSVLQEIGAGDIPQVLVYNKIDRIDGAQPRHDQPNEGRERVWLSARDDLGLDLLQDALTRRLSLVRVQGSLHLPAAHAERLRSRLHALGAVRGETHDEDGWHLQVDLSLADAQRLAVQAGGAPLEALLPEALREEWMA